MKEFFKSKGFKVLVVVALLIGGIMLNSMLNYGVAGTIDGISGMIITPIQKGFTSVGNACSDFFSRFTTKDALNSRIEELEKENAELQDKIVGFEQYKRENEQMKDLLGLKEANPGIELCMSEVVARSSDVWSSSVTIDKGSLDEIKVGDYVITKDNFLIGVVTKVGLTWSTISTVYDSSTYVGAYLSSTRDVGVFESRKTSELRGSCELNYLPADCGVSRGDIVLTSGLSASCPKGIIIGMVEGSELAADGLTMTAGVAPSADISSIRDAFVITAFRGEEDVADGVN